MVLSEPANEGIAVGKRQLLIGVHHVEHDRGSVNRDGELDLSVREEAPERAGPGRRTRFEAPPFEAAEKVDELLAE